MNKLKVIVPMKHLLRISRKSQAKNINNCVDCICTVCHKKIAGNVYRLAVSTGISCSVSLVFVLYQNSDLLVNIYSSACIAANRCYMPFCFSTSPLFIPSLKCRHQSLQSLKSSFKIFHFSVTWNKCSVNDLLCFCIS